MYVIRNLNRLERLPDALREQVFEQLFESAEIARFTPDQIRSYEKSLKFYRDMQNTLETAKEEGRVSGQLKMAKGLLAQGMSVSEIVAISDLTVEQIKELMD